jgi:hypothetical protein
LAWTRSPQSLLPPRRVALGIVGCVARPAMNWRSGCRSLGAVDGLRMPGCRERQAGTSGRPTGACQLLAQQVAAGTPQRRNPAITRPSPRYAGALPRPATAHGPSTGSASASPGHLGNVPMPILSGDCPSVVNWKAVPTGMVTHRPGRRRSSALSPLSLLRQILPLPPMTSQISSTVLCLTARLHAPWRKEQCAKPPASPSSRSRISEPSGAK